ncbi:S8 family peptidase [Streptomyces huiliensis]|uniref:S8 family peptidase n=1 Tax=Streptomyces huiliensis TaxID=2876027 RepID=UPI001CBBFC16|nr:S8/S53 family peptidase [Streptomyces huiliensis]
MTCDVRYGTDPLAPVSLPPLMARTDGRRSGAVGLVDGPVSAGHPGLARAARLAFLGPSAPAGADPDPATLHGTSVAGMLVAARDSGAPGICPGAPLLVRSLSFAAAPGAPGTAAADELAAALVETVDAGARVVNVSLALNARQHGGPGPLHEALEHALRRGAVIVAAAGNQGALGGSPVLRHRSVVPVVAYGPAGPLGSSSLGPSIGRRGVGAVGTGVRSLAAGGGLRPFGGTSAAAAVVTGTLALLWSEFPRAEPVELLAAVRASAAGRTSVAPPLLNAWEAYRTLRTADR